MKVFSIIKYNNNNDTVGALPDTWGNWGTKKG